MENVSGGSPQPERQGPQGPERIIVWSPCPQRARRWERWLTRLQAGPVSMATCPRVLRGALGSRGPGGPPLVLLDFEEHPAQAFGPGPASPTEDGWPLLRSSSLVAVVRNTAIGLLRRSGATNIASACRACAAQPWKALNLIGIQRTE